jgi:hypothetical protein
MIVVALVLMALFAFAPPGVSAAHAQGSDACPFGATIASLQLCVGHAAEMGFIDNQGVTGSLLAKLDAAAAADERGQPQVAVHTIQAFMHEVTAQAGRHIDAEHADHMLAHAQVVIQSLDGSQ